MREVTGKLVQAVVLRRDADGNPLWVPLAKDALEGSAVLPLILGRNMADLVGTCTIDKGIVSGAIHDKLPKGTYYAIPLGTLMKAEMKNKQFAAITKFRLAAIALVTDAPEGAESVSFG